MKKETIKHIYACDFETTVYEGQTNTEVWSSALVQLGTEYVIVHHSLDETVQYFADRVAPNNEYILYYHNLKFDGSFWLDWLLKHDYKFHVDKKSKLEPKEFRCVISDMGQWYTIDINLGSGVIKLKDSLKLMPFTLKQIGKAFNTKHQKLDMEYKGYRYAGCAISDEEMEYIKNDVLVLKEALELLLDRI